MRHIPSATSLMLALTIGALALLNWYIVRMDIPLEPEAVDPPLSMAPALPPAPSAGLPSQDGAMLRDVTARPLFQPDRRPLKREEASSSTVATTTASVSNLALVGIMQDASGASRALIRNSDIAAEWIAVGGSVDGWVVRAIDSRGSVALENRGRRALLSLYRDQ